MTAFHLYFLLLHSSPYLKTVTDLANTQGCLNLKLLRSLAISSHLYVCHDSVNALFVECFVGRGFVLCCFTEVCNFFKLSCRFYSHCEGYEPTLLLIRTTDGDVRNIH